MAEGGSSDREPSAEPDSFGSADHDRMSRVIATRTRDASVQRITEALHRVDSDATRIWDASVRPPPQPHTSISTTPCSDDCVCRSMSGVQGFCLNRPHNCKGELCLPAPERVVGMSASHCVGAGPWSSIGVWCWGWFPVTAVLPGCRIAPVGIGR
jgi:hypothetical protein